LGDFGPDGTRGVPALIKILQDDKESEVFKLDVLIALGRIGPAAKEALPEIDKLTWSQGRIGVWASMAFNRISENR
jgi:hypothetical protein